MKAPKIPLFAALFCAALVNAKEVSAAGKDDASQSAYGSGWNESGGGSGFGDWKFQESHGPADSFAGHFLADSGTNPEMCTVAVGNKAFGLYANGSEFETAAAFPGVLDGLASRRQFLLPDG